jgi:hypothetical protein
MSTQLCGWGCALGRNKRQQHQQGQQHIQSSRKHFFSSVFLWLWCEEQLEDLHFYFFQ